MRELIGNLYEVAGKQGKRITRMLLFDTLKSIFEGVSLVAILVTLKMVCEQVFDGKAITMQSVRTVFGIAALSLAGKILFASLADYNKYKASYHMGAENRLYIGDRLKKVHMGYFSEGRLGNISGGLSTAISELETSGIYIIEHLLTGIIQTVIMLVFLLPYDFRTSLVILITLIIGIYVNNLSQKKIDRLTTLLLDLKLELNAGIIQYVNGIGIIKAFGRAQSVTGELNRAIRKNKEGFLNVEKLLVPIQFLFQGVFKIGICVIILMSIFRFMHGDIDATKCVLLIVSSFVVFSGVETAGGMQSIRGVAVRNLNIVKGLRNLPVISEGKKETVRQARAEFRDVSFGYEEQLLFRHLSADIPEKTSTALVGFSGSGKTTFCNLLARFRDVDAGQVLIDGTDVREYRYDSLLSEFTFVFQDVYLFDDTIKNNIKFGKPDATDKEVEEVARKAQCHEFIMKLPEGYDTKLQEGGSNLSGGERQRISIARAMLKPCKFVILDEATSSVDPENEYQLLSALKNLLKDKTTIIIAHKLSTVRNADRIIVLKDGRIEQSGTHAELEAVEGIYRDFLENRRKAESWSVESSGQEGHHSCQQDGAVASETSEPI